MSSTQRLLRRCALALTLTLAAVGCGDDSSNTNDNIGGGGGGGNTDPCAAIIAQNDGMGQACGLGVSCPSFDCLCEDGSTVSTSSCFNGACEGLAACEQTCQGFGSSDACDDYDPNAGGNNTTANNTTANNTTANNTTANNTTANNTTATCDADISAVLQTRWTRDEACLRSNCCQQTAACAGLANCPLLDDCLYDCFSGGAVDQTCVQSCHEQYPAQPEYQNFSSCALSNC